MKLKIEMHDYWHVGSGLADAGYIDMAVLRNAEGLPYLPGRTLKGLLRSAWEFLDELAPDGDPQMSASQVFGSEDTPFFEGQAQVHCTDAQLSADDRAWLAAPDNQAAKALLFTALHTTAICETEQTEHIKKDKSLRIREVALPLTLEADVFFSAPGAAAKMRKAIPLIRSLGANRHRGLGRCTLTPIAERS